VLDDKQDPAMRDDMVKLLVERTTAIKKAGLMEQQHSNTPIIQQSSIPTIHHSDTPFTERFDL
jgi:hypothetical protein